MTDPGAVQFGNFINYYSFNSAEARLELFPSDIWQTANDSDPHSDTFYALDIGCNAGNFTQLLHKFLTKLTGKHVIILGIDIDATLIERAIEANGNPEQVSYACVDVMDCPANYFETHLQGHGRKQYNAVFCLSLTMWIHLNHGDIGLKNFLTRVAALSQMLIIEPQPWRCYLTAVKRMRKVSFEYCFFKSLQMRNTVENDIPSILADECSMEKVHETKPTKWNRKIYFYRQPNLL